VRGSNGDTAILAALLNAGDAADFLDDAGEHE
jgi:hypothetical protein